MEGEYLRGVIRHDCHAWAMIIAKRMKMRYIQLSCVPGESQRIYLNSFRFHYPPAAVHFITKRKEIKRKQSGDVL